MPRGTLMSLFPKRSRICLTFIQPKQRVARTERNEPLLARTRRCSVRHVEKKAIPVAQKRLFRFPQFERLGIESGQAPRANQSQIRW
jgi:hypothetical protein